MAIEETDLKDIVFVKQLGGVEDLIFGFGSIMQIRNGQSVIISSINAGTIPYDSTDSVQSIIAKILVKYPIV